MKIVLFSAVVLLSLGGLSSQDLSFEYTDQEGSLREVVINEGTPGFGDEKISWQGKTLDVADLSPGREFGAIFEDESESVYLNIYVQSGYDQIIKNLEVDNFCSNEFEICPQSAVGLLMEMDNLSGEIRCYCLSESSEDSRVESQK
jgi:hypothetical protein